MRLRSNNVATIAPYSSRLAPPGATDAAPTVAAASDACTVARWRGYVSSGFYAVRASDGEVVGVSDTFRWRKSAAPPDGGAARRAYDGLVGELVALGWHDAGTANGSDPWYAHRFERGATPVAPVPAAQPSEPIARVTPAPDPQPVPAPEPEPEPAAIASVPSTPASPVSGRAGSSHRRAWFIAAATLALLVSAAAGGWEAVHAGVFDRHGSSRPAPAARASVQQAPAASTAHASAAAATPVGRLRVTGLGKGSWLEVRRGSKHGPVVFSGVVADGKHLRFSGRRLWVMFGAATNLVVTVNGERRPLQGTVEGIVSERGLTAP